MPRPLPPLATPPQVFRLVDEDHSGSISLDEMRQHMQLRGYDDDEIEATVKALDTGAPPSESLLLGMSECLL